MLKNLLDEIAAKVKRKKDLRKEIAERKENIEDFVIKMINDIEDVILGTASTSLLASLVPLCVKSFEARIKAIDPGSSVLVKWSNLITPVPRIEGVLIKWSKDYQEENNCDEQLFVDVTNLLLI